MEACFYILFILTVLIVLNLLCVRCIFRYTYPWWREKELVSEARRSQGMCPLTPEETTLVLQALGFQKDTQIYIASGEIYGSERRLASLRAAFPRLVIHLTLHLVFNICTSAATWQLPNFLSSCICTKTWGLSSLRSCRCFYFYLFWYPMCWLYPCIISGEKGNVAWSWGFATVRQPLIPNGSPGFYCFSCQ